MNTKTQKIKMMETNPEEEAKNEDLFSFGPETKEAKRDEEGKRD